MKLDKMKVGITVEIKPNWKQTMTKIAKENGAILCYNGEKERSTYEEDDIIQLNNLIGKPLIVSDIDFLERTYLSIELKHDSFACGGTIWINHKCLKRFK